MGKSPRPWRPTYSGPGRNLEKDAVHCADLMRVSGWGRRVTVDRVHGAPPRDPGDRWAPRSGCLAGSAPRVCVARKALDRNISGKCPGGLSARHVSRCAVRACTLRAPAPFRPRIFWKRGLEFSLEKSK
jgi:hypothetical protein